MSPLSLYICNKQALTNMKNKHKIYTILFSIYILLSGYNSIYAMDKSELDIITNGDKDTSFRILKTNNIEDSIFLRQNCSNLDISKIKENKYLEILIARLKTTMNNESGVGIAAPQVGIGRNLFLFTRIDKEGHPIQVAINPKIINHSENTICFQGDGCLSIPNERGNSIRYEWIEVEYFDENGNLIQEKLSGYSRSTDFTNIIFQHEFDHLNGILFIDKLCD